MELHEYLPLDGVGLAELIRRGEVTAGEVETVARTALAAADERVNGLTRAPFTPALDASADGPFAGVPFLTKDVPIAAGVPFTLGSRAVPDILARHDSELMTRFRRAGLVTLGTTTMCELGLSFATESARYGATRNPYDPDRGAGGSSGGAAALVAAGAVPLAHANDGAGSIRVPASCCGLVGLKPSRGRVPCGPDTGEAAFGLLYEFAVTRSVRDAAHLLDAVHGPATGDKYTAPPPPRPFATEVGAPQPPLRVGLTTEAWSGTAVDLEVAAATVHAGHLLERLGHLVEPAPHGTLDYDNPAYTVDSWLRRLFEYGPFTAVFNISGQPAVSLPLGRSASGLPIGVQLVARDGREDLLLRVAAALEPDFATRPVPVEGRGVHG